MSTTDQPVTPVVTRDRNYHGFNINNIYVSDYGDMLYLYDPDNAPEDLYQHSPKTLYLPRAEAEALRDNLTELLK